MFIHEVWCLEENTVFDGVCLFIEFRIYCVSTVHMSLISGLFEYLDQKVSLKSDISAAKSSMFPLLYMYMCLSAFLLRTILALACRGS